MSIKFRTVVSVMAAGTVAAFSLPASASAKVTDAVVVTGSPDADVETRTVDHRDLDLARAQDQRRLHRRVDHAVKDVCALNDYYSRRTIVASSDYFQCSDSAWAGARPQIANAIRRALAGTDPADGTGTTTTVRVSATAGG